jgi:hypothetical protein
MTKGFKLSLLISAMLFVLSSIVTAAPMYERLWGNILTQHSKVDTRDRMKCTLVNYSELKRSQTFKSILRFLSKFDYNTLETKDDQMAFWINVYNISAINFVTEHYPVDNVLDLSSNDVSYSNLKIITVYNEKYSLNEIKEKLLFYNDDRVLFTLSNGALSEPQLLQTPYTSLKIEDQLKSSTFSFINERFRGVDIKKETNYIYVSTLFQNNAPIFENEQKIKHFIAPNFKENIDSYRLFYLRENHKINDY